MKLPINWNNRRGFTLVELIVSIMLTALVVGAAVGLYQFGLSSYDRSAQSYVNRQNAKLVETYLRTAMSNVTAVYVTGAPEAGSLKPNAVLYAVGGEGENGLLHYEINGADLTVKGIRQIDFWTQQTTADGATVTQLYYTIMADTGGKAPYTLTGNLVLNNNPALEKTGGAGTKISGDQDHPTSILMGNDTAVNLYFTIKK